MAKVIKIAAGALRHRLKVQERSEATDSDGGVTPTWSTKATVWAAIDPGVGTERIHGQSVDSTKTFTITMRHYAGLDPTYRLVRVSDNRAFNIIDVSDPQELGSVMTVTCREDTSGADD